MLFIGLSFVQSFEGIVFGSSDREVESPKP